MTTTIDSRNEKKRDDTIYALHSIVARERLNDLLMRQQQVVFDSNAGPEIMHGLIRNTFKLELFNRLFVQLGE